MPAIVCGKPFKASDAQYPFTSTINQDRHGDRPTLRDMVLHVTNDGDFKSCSIADGTVEFRRVRTLPNGERLTRTRTMDIRSFPSVADCVVEEDSDDYYAILDCFAEVE